jgi:xanthine/uracil/vitamin C permease (AzgA family)
MQKTNAPTFAVTIVAIIVGVALFKQIDFKNFTVEKPALSAIYFVTFVFSVYVLIKNSKKNLEK